MAKQKREDLLVQLYHARQKADQGVNPNDESFALVYPGLWQLSTLVWLDDTHRVEPAQIIAWNATGDWAFKVSSPAMRGSKTVMVKTFAEGLPSLELAVWNHDIPWQFYLKRKPGIREVKPEKNGLAVD